MTRTKFLANVTQREGDYVQSSAGAADASKAVLLDDNGYIDKSMIQHLRFGGDGSDGALNVSSGTTNIDLGGVQVFIKNYSSISITGTGAVTFSNAHANGTIIIFKCKGDFTVTSSATWAIDALGLGAAFGRKDFDGSNWCRGGNGGSCLYVEVGGNWNKTGNIRCNGQDASETFPSWGGAVGASTGGGAGFFLGQYNGSLVANTGTLTVAAGANANSHASGGTASIAGTNGSDAFGIMNNCYGGAGGGVAKSPAGVLEIANTLLSSMFYSKTIMLCCGGGGAAGGNGPQNASSPAGFNLAIVRKNTEFV